MMGNFNSDVSGGEGIKTEGAHGNFLQCTQWAIFQYGV
jgi:hypothetical protein